MENTEKMRAATVENYWKHQSKLNLEDTITKYKPPIYQLK